MLEMYYTDYGGCYKQEGEKFINNRLKEFITDYILEEVIENSDDEDFYLNFVREDYPKVKSGKHKGMMQGNLDQIYNVGIMRHNKLFGERLAEMTDLYPGDVTPERATEIFFDLYQVIWSENTHKPDWYAQYMLYRIIEWHLELCHDIPEVRKKKKRLPKKLREKMIEELKEELGEPESEDDVTPEYLISIIEDASEYPEYCFYDHDFLMLDKTSLEALNETGVYQYTDMDFFGDLADIKKEELLNELAKGFTALCFRNNDVLETAHAKQTPITDAIMKELNSSVTDMVYTVFQYIFSNDENVKNAMQWFLMLQSRDYCGRWYDAKPKANFEEFFNEQYNIYMEKQEKIRKENETAEKENKMEALKEVLKETSDFKTKTYSINPELIKQATEAMEDAIEAESDKFYVDIVELPDMYEAYIYSTEYGTKEHIFGIPKVTDNGNLKISYDDFKDIVTRNIQNEDYIVSYIQNVM